MPARRKVAAVGDAVSVAAMPRRAAAVVAMRHRVEVVASAVAEKEAAGEAAVDSRRPLRETWQAASHF
jgi:hypothetical protein